VSQVNDATAAAGNTLALTEKAAASVEVAAKEVSQSSQTLAGQFSASLVDVNNAIRQLETKLVTVLDDMEKRTDTNAQAFMKSVLSASGELRNSVSGLEQAVHTYTNRTDEGRDNIGRLITDHEEFLHQFLNTVNGRAADPMTALTNQLTALDDTIRKTADLLTQPKNNIWADSMLSQLQEIRSQLSGIMPDSGQRSRTRSPKSWFRW
jgi:division protein CdvB (Snf7/Vps24/ESCRT-III family)